MNSEELRKKLSKDLDKWTIIGGEERTGMSSYRILTGASYGPALLLCPDCGAVLEYALDLNDGRGTCRHCGYVEAEVQ